MGHAQEEGPAGKPVEVELDNDGFLKEMSTWDRNKARDLGWRNDIGPLTPDHWKVIDFVRTYYLQTGMGPPVVRVGKATGLSPRQICELFPCGMARGAYRLAGLPRPHGCV